MEIKEKQENNKALLVGVQCRGDDDTEILLDELQELAESAGIEVMAKVIQQRQTPDPATYIGSGKAEELYKICDSNEIGLAIFDTELSPSQIKNLEDAFCGTMRVIDRSMLILDIFALHANSSEGKLQVELAQLQYTAPRLIGRGTQLSRQQGGNIAMRGPGESKLESDRRYLKRRMDSLLSQLDEVEKNRETMRARRDKSGIKQVAIAGYTNAGKSTLLNYLTDAGILAEDKLFATLDPTTRKYTLPCGEDILLTDTVGFIRKLPHHLIKAFGSTLDEVKYADVIIVVIDASDENYSAQTEVTKGLLCELGAGGKPVIYAFNKCDRPAFDIPRLKDVPADDVVYISALTGQGVDRLINKIEEIALDGRKNVILHIPNDKLSVINTLYSVGTVRNVEYTDEYAVVEALLDKKGCGMTEKYIVK